MTSPGRSSLAHYHDVWVNKGLGAVSIDAEDGHEIGMTYEDIY
jgi:hypothetical protein